MENSEHPTPDVEERRLKRWPVVILGVVLALALAVLAMGLWVHAKRVPVYKGKTGDQWLTQMLTTNQRSAVTAFREMDTNATPFLARALDRHETQWDRYYDRVYRQAPPVIKTHLTPPVSLPETWTAAQLALMNLPEPTRHDALPEMVKLMENRGSQSQLYGARVVINTVKPEDVDCVPALARCLHDPNKDIRHSSAMALKKIGTNASAAVPDLVSALKDPVADTRAAIAWALWNVNQQTNGVAEALQSAMKEQPPGNLRDCSVYYLSQVTPEDVALIPELVAMTKGPDDYFATLAAKALGKYGPAAKSATEALVHRTQIGSPELKKAAAEALQKIDGGTAAKNDLK